MQSWTNLMIDERMDDIQKISQKIDFNNVF